MAFVDKHQRIAWKIIDHRGRWITRRCARQVSRIVFNAFTETKLSQHLKIKARALFDALRLDQMPRVNKLFDALAQLLLDGFNRTQDSVARRHVMRPRVHGKARHLLPYLACQGVE